MGERPVLALLAAGQAKRYGGCKPLAPVGLHGEAVIDLTVADAVAAGFADVVLILGPATGPAIEYHVRRTWPARLRVRTAYQPVPLGTAHAVLCARRQVGERPFAVVNGDDVYGTEAFEQLRAHFADPDQADTHALVAFELGRSVVGGNPVTRGTVSVDAAGMLVGIDERRTVQAGADGSFRVGDGRQPAVLDPGTLVSMNLWGLHPSIWPVLAKAVAGVHPDAPLAPEDGGRAASDEEVLLPEVVGAMAADGRDRVRVLRSSGRCVGVTHADDLPVVRNVLAAMVGAGERSEWPWAVDG